MCSAVRRAPHAVGGALCIARRALSPCALTPRTGHRLLRIHASSPSPVEAATPNTGWRRWLHRGRAFVNLAPVKRWRCQAFAAKWSPALACPAAWASACGPAGEVEKPCCGDNSAAHGSRGTWWRQDGGGWHRGVSAAPAVVRRGQASLPVRDSNAPLLALVHPAAAHHVQLALLLKRERVRPLPLDLFVLVEQLPRNIDVFLQELAQ